MEILHNGSDKLLRSYEVSILAEDIAPQLDNILQRNAHKFKISGFRAGKAPLSMLRTQYGHRYIYEALQAVVESFLSKQLSEMNEIIALKADYNIESVNSENGSYVINVTYHVFPTISVDDYTDLKTNHYIVDLSDDYIAEELERLRKHTIKWVAANNDTVEDGMRVTISGSSTVISNPKSKKGKHKKENKPKSFKEQAFVVSAQSKTALMSALLGAKLGEQIKFSQEVSNGQVYEYCATIDKIESPSEHELNDEFAIASGKESLSALTEEIRNTISQRFQEMARELSKRDLLEAFAEKYQFDVPENVFAAERENVRKQVLHETAHNSLQIAKGKEDAFEAAVDDLTRQRIRISFVINNIAAKEDISVTNKDVQQQIWMYAQMHGAMAAQAYSSYLQNPDIIRIAREDALKNHTLSLVIEKLERIEKKISREELIALDEENFPFIEECFVVAKHGDNSSNTSEESLNPQEKQAEASEDMDTVDSTNTDDKVETKTAKPRKSATSASKTASKQTEKAKKAGDAKKTSTKKSKE